MDLYNTQSDNFSNANINYPMVNENFTCSRWECAEDVSITPMRECWYCRYSDFRKDSSAHKTTSICRNPLYINKP